MMTPSVMRQTLRPFSTFPSHCSKETTPIPGLHVYRDFLQTDVKDEVQKKAINLHRAIFKNSADSSTCPCKTFLSQRHNLKSDEYYRLVKLQDDSGKKIKGQYFEKYGEDGHRLTYFIGNQSIPTFIKNHLILKILHLPEVKALTQNGETEWNFTFNTYATMKNSPERCPGFDFHKDIESNGEATLIYSIGSPSEFQIRHPENIEKMRSIPLLDNTLILLSQEARYDYEHRVIPAKISENSTLFKDEVEAIKRVSLVVGFNKTSKEDILDEMARDLIFSGRKYHEFTEEEKQIVDDYQEKLLEEDWLVLPNTALEQEQIEIAKLVEKRKKTSPKSSKWQDA